MLLLCEGPDTYRALEKARELERAFREKYDAAGFSVERISYGKEAARDVVQRAGGMSLFSPRRFLRTMNVVAELAKKDEAAFVKVLTQDPDALIVVSVEDEPISPADAKKIEKIPKVMHYPFPRLEGSAFLDWVKKKADELGVVCAQSTLQGFTDQMEGDTWGVMSELQKLRASGSGAALDERHEEESSKDDVFLSAERIIYQEGTAKDRRATSAAVLMQSYRQAIRMRDEATQGIPPFLLKKFKFQPLPKNADVRFLAVMRGLAATRTGFCTESETSLLEGVT